MTKKEKWEKDYKEAVKIFEKCNNKEEANEYIKAEIYERKFSKALMSVYIDKYATEEDAKWITGDFRKEAYRERPVQIETVVTDANGIVVHKEGKNGKAIPKKVRVNSITGETKIVFSIHHARKEFQKHFGIEFKPTGYVPKEKKEEEKVVDPFLAMIAKFEKEDNNKEENKETKKKK